MPINSSFGSISNKGVRYTTGRFNFISSSSAAFTGALATNLGNFSITVNRTYILMIAHDPTGNALPTITSVTNGQSVGTWTAITPAFTAPATTSSGAGVITRAYIMKATATNASSSITINFSAAPAKGAYILYQVDNLTTSVYAPVGQLRGTNAGPSGGGPYPSMPRRDPGDFSFGFIGWEQNSATITNTSSPPGDWSTPVARNTTGGGSAANIAIAASYYTNDRSIYNTLGILFGLRNSNNSNWAAQVVTVKAF
ncbi:MAG: hypothetical protein ACK5DE_14425 [Bacteroidota bacterium]|jgi:hypothetical protein